MMLAAFQALPGCTVNSTLLSLGQLGMLYGHAKEQRALELDGKQVVSLSFVAAARLAILRNQIAPIAPLYHSKIEIMVMLTGLFTGVSEWVACSIQMWAKEHKVQKILWLGNQIEKVSYLLAQGFQVSDRIIEIASLGSYVALCALGFPVQGAIGLSGLLLVELKRHSLLPMLVDRYLENCLRVASLIYSFTQPMFWVLRALNIYSDLSFVFQSISDYTTHATWMPLAIRDPFYNLHQHEPINKVSYLMNQDRLMFAPFRVNPTYVHAPEVADILPPDYLHELDAVPMEQVFADLEAAIQGLRGPDGDPEWALQWAALQAAPAEGSVHGVSGYQKLKIAALTGRVEDQLPPNVEEFQRFIKALAHSMLQDPRYLKSRLLDLERIGKQCVERWTSEVQFLFCPKTKNLRWAVHNLLAKMRGIHLQETLLEIGESMKEERYDSLFKIAGGDTSIHVLNAYHAGFRSIFRTYEGEIQAKIRPYGIIESLFRRYVLLNSYIPKYMDGANLTFKGFLNNWAIGVIAADSNPATLVFGGAMPLLMYSKIGKHFKNSEVLVEAVYEAIYPQLLPREDVPGEVEVRREIQWEGVTTWAATFAEKLEGALEHEDQDAPTVFYLRYVKNVELGGKQVPYLNKEGVRLMLWDLGILKM